MIAKISDASQAAVAINKIRLGPTRSPIIPHKALPKMPLRKNSPVKIAAWSSARLNCWIAYTARKPVAIKPTKFIERLAR